MFDRLARAWHAYGLEQRVRRHGWTAVYVGDYEAAPSWIYSVGFDGTLDQPEAIIFDVPKDQANNLMWMIFRGLQAGTLVLEDGLDWSDFVGERCVWRKVDPSQIDNVDRWLVFANLRREKRTGRRFGLEAFQLVICDPERRMPWEDGYDEHLRPRQPALWIPAACPERDVHPLEAEARRLVRERGWTAVPVSGSPLNWAYTIGLQETIGTPDLIAFSRQADDTCAMLIDIRAHLKGGLELEDGLRWSAGPFELCFREVHESHYLGFNWFYLAKEIREERTGRRDAFPAFQAFAPDDAGRYPWERGCLEPYRSLQPLLFEPLDLARLPSRALAGAQAV